MHLCLPRASPLFALFYVNAAHARVGDRAISDYSSTGYGVLAAACGGRVVGEPVVVALFNNVGAGTGDQHRRLLRALVASDRVTRLRDLPVCLG